MMEHWYTNCGPQRYGSNQGGKNTWFVLLYTLYRQVTFCCYNFTMLQTQLLDLH